MPPTSKKRVLENKIANQPRSCCVEQVGKTLYSIQCSSYTKQDT